MGRVLAKSGAQGRTCLDIASDVVEQPDHAWIAVATANHVKTLKKRHARFHHGGQLPCEASDIVGRNSAARRPPLTRNDHRLNALSPQQGHDLIFAHGPNLTANCVACAVGALPFEDDIGKRVRSGCHGHSINRFK